MKRSDEIALLTDKLSKIKEDIREREIELRGLTEYCAQTQKRLNSSQKKIKWLQTNVKEMRAAPVTTLYGWFTTKVLLEDEVAEANKHKDTLKICSVRASWLREELARLGHLVTVISEEMSQKRATICPFKRTV
jgi:hypothetical protein